MGQPLHISETNRYVVKDEKFAINDKSYSIEVIMPIITVDVLDKNNEIHKIKRTSIRNKDSIIASCITTYIPFAYNNKKYKLEVIMNSTDFDTMHFKNDFSVKKTEDENFMASFMYVVSKQKKDSSIYERFFAIYTREIYYYPIGDKEYFRFTPRSIENSFEDKRVYEYRHREEFIKCINKAMRKFPLGKVKHIFANIEGI